MSDDTYIAALERQCSDWERMYVELKAKYNDLIEERDQLKMQLEISRNPSAMTEKQIRHV